MSRIVLSRVLRALRSVLGVSAVIIAAGEPAQGQSSPQLATLSFSPSTVTGAAGSTGAVSLYGTAPAGGVSVRLRSASSLATVPSAVIVPSGQASATFSIGTSSPPARTTVSISATLGWSTRSSLLSLLPAGLNPQVPQGGGSSFRDNGTAAPGAGVSWDIVRAGASIASSGLPSGWAVSYDSSSHVFVVTSPASAPISPSYQVRYTTGAANYSALFDVVAVSVGISGSRHPVWSEDARAYDSAPVGSFGPSAADSVDLATGVYLNDPGPDLACRNPLGPDVVYERSYRSDLALEGYASPGLSPGWTDNFDVCIEPVGSGSGWSTLKLRHTNGAIEVFSPLFSSSGTPTGRFSVPTGAPYFVTGVPSTVSGRWKSIKITSADESSVSFTPDPLDASRYLLSAITNIVGRSIYVVRDPRLGDRITAVTDDSARPNSLLLFAYDATGHLASVREICGRRVDYTFALSGGATSLQCVSQTHTAFTRALTGWTYAYTAVLGQPLLTAVAVPNPTGALGSIGHPIAYDTKGRVTALTDANNRRRTYNYGAGATQIAVLDEKGAVTIAWSQKISARSTDAGSVDALGGTTTAAYVDPANPDLPTHLTNENGQTVEAHYDAHGNVILTRDLRGVQTVFTYDYSLFPLGRLMSVQQGAKTPTRFTYYPNGLLATVDTPRPGTVSANQWVRTTYTYTALGNVAAVVMPAPSAYGTVTIHYGYTSDPQYGYSKSEALGEPVTVTDPLGNTTHFQYDRCGNCTRVIDAEGNRWDYVYDDSDRLVTALEPPTGQQGPGRVTTVYKYLGPDGPLQSVSLYDEAGVLVRSGSGSLGKEGELLRTQTSTIPKQLTALYDGAYRPFWLQHAGSDTIQQKFDSAGNRTYLRWPYAGDKYFTRFDPAGSLLEMTDSYGFPVKINRAADDSRILRAEYGETGRLGFNKLNTSYSHDVYGRVVTASNGVSTLKYEYDDNDAVTSLSATYSTDIFPDAPVSLPTKTVSFSFNSDGSRASMSTPAGAFLYAFDAAGRMTTASFPWTDGSVSYTYFRNGWLKSQQTSKVTTTYSYTARGNLLNLTNKDGSGNTLSAFTGMLYNGAGQRTYMAVTVPGVTSGGSTVYEADSGSVSYEYDGEGRLTRENAVRSSPYSSYDYHHSWHADGTPSQIRNIGWSLSNGVTANGDLPSGLYDRLSRQIYHYADIPTNPPSNAYHEWNGAYRPDGLRAYKWQTSNYPTYAEKRFYLYDGTHVLCEFDENGALAAAYGFGAHGLVQAKVYGTDAATYNYAFDPQGSPVQRLEGAQPNIYFRFEAFGGKQTAHGNPSIYRREPVGYGGQWGAYTDHVSYGPFIPELYDENILMGYRFYSPRLAIFLTQDPIGYEGGYNLYVYCDGDPVNSIDPWGLSFWDNARTWYMNGMGGFSDWVDRNVMLGATQNFGDTAGRFDSGKASMGEVVWSGAKFGGMLAANGVSIGKSLIGVVESAHTKFAERQIAGALERAKAVVGPGRGSAYGSRLHGEFANQVEALGSKTIRSEVSYLRSETVRYGTKGSIRVDVQIESVLGNGPKKILDLKSGTAKLTELRKLRIRAHLPAHARRIPIQEIR